MWRWDSVLNPFVPKKLGGFPGVRRPRISLLPTGLPSGMLLCWSRLMGVPTQQRLKQVPWPALQRQSHRSHWASGLAARSKHMLPRSQESSLEMQPPGCPEPQGPAELMGASWDTILSSVSVPQAPSIFINSSTTIAIVIISTTVTFPLQAFD